MDTVTIYVVTLTYGDDPHDCSVYVTLSEDDAFQKVDYWKDMNGIDDEEYYNENGDVMVFKRDITTVIPEFLKNKFNIVT